MINIISNNESFFFFTESMIIVANKLECLYTC